MSTEVSISNPSKWRYTWEAQSHLPILKLFLFNPQINPLTHCKSLKTQLIIENSILRITWFEHDTEVGVNVPLPRVLVDSDAPVGSKVLDDCIEVRVVLLLPVDHPILFQFHKKKMGSGGVDMSSLSDVKRLSSESEGVAFYCRSCSAQLTRPIKSFAEMPSTNWSEVADNWFGGCCCSFGGASDKLVAKYANSYASTAGTCLLSTMFVVLCTDDLIWCIFPSGDGSKEEDVVSDSRIAICCEQETPDNRLKHTRVAYDNGSKEDVICCNDSGETLVASDLKCHQQGSDAFEEVICSMSTASELSYDVLSASGCCDGAHNHIRKIENGSSETSGTCLDDQPLIKTFGLPENQKSFLNGFLGDIFMARSSNLSKDVCWVELLCPQCSCFLGAYPADNKGKILDGAVRLFKCYISTRVPTGGSKDLFRKYTLERMFTNQLMENAKTELSYRTIIRDLQTKAVMLQIVLLNPDSFVRSGYCFGTENQSKSVDKVDLSSAIKVLFADYEGGDVSQTRLIEEWVKEDKADEVYMFGHQINELTKALRTGKEMFPPSCTSLQGLMLSLLRR